MVCTLDPLPLFFFCVSLSDIVVARGPSIVSEAADLRILFLILVTDLPPSIALGMEPGERTLEHTTSERNL